MQECWIDHSQSVVLVGHVRAIAWPGKRSCTSLNMAFECNSCVMDNGACSTSAYLEMPDPSSSPNPGSTLGINCHFRWKNISTNVSGDFFSLAIPLVCHIYKHGMIHASLRALPGTIKSIFHLKHLTPSQANPSEDLLNDCSTLAAFTLCKDLISSLAWFMRLIKMHMKWCNSMSSPDEFYSSEIPCDLHFVIAKNQRSSLEENVLYFILRIYGPVVQHQGQRYLRACCERLTTLGELIMSSASFASPWVWKVLSTNSVSELIEMDHWVQEETEFQRAADLQGT